jgi:hypothetical protein
MPSPTRGRAAVLSIGADQREAPVGQGDEPRVEGQPRRNIRGHDGQQRNPGLNGLDPSRAAMFHKRASEVADRARPLVR